MCDKIVLLFPFWRREVFPRFKIHSDFYSPIKRISSYFRFSFICYYTPLINLVFIAYYHVCYHVGFHVCYSCHLSEESAQKEHRYTPSYYNGGILRCSPHPRPPKRLVTQTRAFGWSKMTSVTFCHYLSQSYSCHDSHFVLTI